MKRVVVISGGSDGLGRQIAKKLSPKNTVVILSPNEEKLKKVSKVLGCKYEVCDVSDYEQVESVVENIIKRHKRIDVLVNNAGLWIQDELDTNDPDWIKRVVEVNLTGVIFLSKAVIPQMKKQKKGLIININSQAGFYAKAERSVYNPTKWGVTGFTKSLQMELDKYGIGVTGIYPGKMKTGMFEKLGVKKDMSDALDVKHVAETIDFILKFPKEVLFPEIGIKYLGYNTRK